MIFPVRCFTCNKVISQYWKEYSLRTTEKDEKPADVLDNLHIKRYCCRRMFLGHVEIIDRMILNGSYKKNF